MRYTKFFTKESLKENDIPSKLSSMKDQLEKYYLPCKAKTYITDITEKRCITILRQFVKIHDYKCIGMEKSVKGKKMMTYRLLYSKDDYLQSPIPASNEGYVLSFE